MYKRTCTFPFAGRLFIGYGEFATSMAKLNQVWNTTRRWQMWLDGQPVDLSAFGTQDRILYGWPPAGGKIAYVRQWRVTADGVTPGNHRLRYVVVNPPAGREGRRHLDVHHAQEALSPRSEN